MIRPKLSVTLSLARLAERPVSGCVRRRQQRNHCAAAISEAAFAVRIHCEAVPTHPGFHAGADEEEGARD